MGKILIATFGYNEGWWYYQHSLDQYSVRPLYSIHLNEREDTLIIRANTIKNRDFMPQIKIRNKAVNFIPQKIIRDITEWAK